MRKYLLYLLFIAIASGLNGQDIHYSQFYNSPLNVNPAKTGIFNGDKRINLSYKSQWRSVPVPWTTFSGSFDRKFYPKYGKQHFFSVGALFNYDIQGELTGLNLTNFNVTGSWTKILNENNLFTIGAQLGFSTRGFDSRSLSWDSQWNGFELDLTRPTGENFDAERVSFLETGLGLNYRWQKSKRTKLDLGLGIFHFIEPGVGFYEDDDISLPRRFSLTGVGSFVLMENVDIQLNALGQFQGDYSELIISGLGKFHASKQRGKEVEFHAGIGWRSGKSWFPIIALQYKRYYLSFSYDIDTTNFDEIHNQRRPTSFEMHFRYIITDVKPKVKVCPIF